MQFCVAHFIKHCKYGYGILHFVKLSNLFMLYVFCRVLKGQRASRESKGSSVAGDYPGQWEAMGQKASRETLETEGEREPLAIM